MKRVFYKWACGLFVLLTAISCGKNFLEIKSDASIGTPYKLEDYQAIMDNLNGIMNTRASVVLGFSGNDEFFLTTPVWERFASVVQRNAYLWADDVYERNDVDDWNNGYVRILNTNMVLEGLAKLDRTAGNSIQYDYIKGSALFFRALSHYQLAQLFAIPYRKDQESKVLGIPLRMESDMTVKTVRSSLSETYQAILNDLGTALKLLPESSSIKVRASGVACHGLLARVYLTMQDYQKAYEHASQSLAIQSGLLDYTKLSASATFPFVADYGASNPEVIFYQENFSVSIIGRTIMDASPDLLQLYREGDVRRNLFFNVATGGNTFFRGSYSGRANTFVGISVPEMMLIYAESAVRLNKKEEAIEILNALSEMRFDTNFYQPYALDRDADDVLKDVIEERRRELAFRGLRWEDLRRLNQDPRFAKTIRREIGGKQYILEPNSKKYTWPIPDRVIELSGLTQNDR